MNEVKVGQCLLNLFRHHHRDGLDNHFTKLD